MKSSDAAGGELQDWSDGKGRVRLGYTSLARAHGFQ